MEYAEYVRRGMGERSHKAEAEERLAKEKEISERRKKERMLREKTKLARKRSSRLSFVLHARFTTR